MILVIGSHALNKIKYIREPKDLDLVMTIETLNQVIKEHKLAVFPKSGSLYIGTYENKPIEIHLAWPNSTNEELLTAHKDKHTKKLDNLDVTYTDLDWLYSLKLSHRYKKDSPHFLKTMEDIHILRNLNASIPNKEWFKKRQKETLAKHPKLNQDKQAFFDTPGVNYIYDHDSIHNAMAMGEKPAYLYYQAPNTEVWCSKEKWNELDHQTKLNGVLEEALVLALERSQIPFDFRPNKDKSFTHALMKVCTSITSGWFREWAWEHYYEVTSFYKSLNFDYVQKFNNALNNNIVKKIKE